jgi:hypothetical protein
VGGLRVSLTGGDTGAVEAVAATARLLHRGHAGLHRAGGAAQEGLRDGVRLVRRASAPPLRTALSRITSLNGNTLRNFPTHGQLSAAQGSPTTVSA